MSFHLRVYYSVGKWCFFFVVVVVVVVVLFNFLFVWPTISCVYQK